MIWKTARRTLTFERPLIMGIINLTPDSFYDGGVCLAPGGAVARAEQLIKEGADILDFGAESTRPGAQAVSEAEERLRLLTVIAEVAKRFRTAISVDTTKAAVASAAADLGAEIVNDVSGLREDPQMTSVVRETKAGVIVMHRRGNAQTMQSFTHYGDLLSEVMGELCDRVGAACAGGVGLDQIVLDPGIGFSKTPEQNLELIEHLDYFKGLGRPVLAGLSRKSFIGRVTGQEPEKRLYGTLAACVLAYERGAQILRVHDVRAAKEALAVAQAIIGRGKGVTV